MNQSDRTTNDKKRRPFLARLIYAMLVGIPKENRARARREMPATHGEIDELKAQICILQDQIRMLQWNLVIKQKMENPQSGEVISMRTGETLGFTDEEWYEDEDAHWTRIASDEVPPWQDPEVVKKFGKNLDKEAPSEDQP